MNVIITLPDTLIKKIWLGYKTIELRKVKPLNFDVEKDRVFVVEKGTRKVVLRFAIRRFTEWEDAATFAYCHHEQVGWPTTEILKYINHSKRFYAWEIDSRTVLAIRVPLDNFKDVSRNPQCFCYTKYFDKITY